MMHRCTNEQNCDYPLCDCGLQQTVESIAPAPSDDANNNANDNVSYVSSDHLARAFPNIIVREVVIQNVFQYICRHSEYSIDRLAKDAKLLMHATAKEFKLAVTRYIDAKG